MHLIFLGAPGTGKGTQAKLFQERMGLVQVSTGDILRDAVTRGTELGRQAKAYMDRGDLVPDEIMVGIIAARLRQPDVARGFILDGFPRTLPQAEALERVLAEMGPPIDAVVYFDMDEETAIRRSVARRICRTCGAIYNLDSHPPVRPGVCDLDGGELYQREDDRPEVARRRHQVYRAQTAPLEVFYRARGVYHVVGARQPVETLYETIRRLVTPSRDGVQGRSGGGSAGAV